MDSHTVRVCQSVQEAQKSSSCCSEHTHRAGLKISTRTTLQRSWRQWWQQNSRRLLFWPALQLQMLANVLYSLLYLLLWSIVLGWLILDSFSFSHRKGYSSSLTEHRCFLLLSGVDLNSSAWEQGLNVAFLLHYTLLFVTQNIAASINTCFSVNIMHSLRTTDTVWYPSTKPPAIWILMSLRYETVQRQGT